MILTRQKIYSDDNGIKGAAITAGIGGGLSYAGYRNLLGKAQADTGINAVREQIGIAKNPGSAVAEGVSSATAKATSDASLFRQNYANNTLKNGAKLEEGVLNGMREKNIGLLNRLESGGVKEVGSVEKALKGRNNILRKTIAKKALLPGLAVTGLASAGYLGYKQLTKNKKEQ